MHRSRPAAFALACVLLWLVQLGLTGAAFLAPGEAPPARYWQIANVVVAAVLGVLLLEPLRKALRWRPRRSVRPSPALQAERQRIARELHDSVGAQLVNAMALLDPAAPEQRQALQTLEQCLLDLRCIVDAMDGSDDSLSDRLARLRHRIQPVLERRGIHMLWRVDGAGHPRIPKGEAALHLAAIVQEALSNMLQHAQATQVEVALAYAPGEGAWRLQVSDNGRGLPTAQGEGAAGQGLAGMRRRAHLAGGSLQLLRPAQGAGTCVCVLLPCARDVPSYSDGLNSQ